MWATPKGATRNAFLRGRPAFLPPFVVPCVCASPPRPEEVSVVQHAPFDPIDPFIHYLIRRKVRQLVRRPGFRPAERDDLEHHLIVEVLQRWSSFDADKANHHAFALLIVHHALADIVRHRQAAKRTAPGLTSLASFGDDEIADPAKHAPLRIPSQTDLALDVGDLLSRLPPDLRQLAEQLKERTLSEIARLTGVPRTTLQGRLLRIRERFQDAGLQEYLSPSGSAASSPSGSAADPTG
jgi:RNA polymerase sigma factor (sigma-70 family)